MHAPVIFKQTLNLYAFFSIYYINFRIFRGEMIYGPATYHEDFVNFGNIAEVFSKMVKVLRKTWICCYTLRMRAYGRIRLKFKKLL